MSADEVEVLDYLRPDSWTSSPGAAWSTATLPHVPAINGRAARAILDGIAEAERNPHASALGLAVTGRKGTGKTHLVTWARPAVQDRGGYYFLAEFTDGRGFWNNLSHTLLNGLRQPHTQDESQLILLLKRLGSLAEVDEQALDQLLDQRKPTRGSLNRFIGALWRVDRGLTPTRRSTLRSLFLLAADDMTMESVGDAYLRSSDEMEPGERAEWEMHTETRTPRHIVEDVTWLIALTGPSLLAVDQFDALFREHSRVTGDNGRAGRPDGDLGLLEEFGQGFMDLYQATRRTFTLIACLPETWTDFQANIIGTAADRFRDEIRLGTIPTPEAGMALIERHFAPGFETAGHTPRYPTWPIGRSCFDQAIDYSPRELLKRVGDHIDRCRANGAVTELEAFDDVAAPVDPLALGEDTSEVEALYRRLLAQIDVGEVFAQDDEDYRMPSLLEAVVSASAIESGGRELEFNAPPENRPDVHLRVYSEDESGAEQRRWSFRAIAKTHHRAVKARVDKFTDNCGLGLAGSHAFLLRTGAWQTGPKTKDSIETFKRRGGVVLEPSPEDLRVFAAIEQLMSERPRGIEHWLRERRPIGSTCLADTLFTADDRSGPADHTPVEPLLEDGPSGDVPPMVFGQDFATGRPVGVELKQLRQHLSVFAGSGSGKTVMLRRLIEACALNGVSSIVIDSNNDLARLGTPWPHPPEGFSTRDAADAERYFAETDVAVWTPGRTAGRPLKFAPLPDFGAVRGDPDDFRHTIDAAVEMLAPRAKVGGESAKDVQSRAVLREALIYYAAEDRKGLPALLELLSELPPEATTLARGHELGAVMSENLRAAIINDPLLSDGGTELDPGVLLEPPPGKRARVSVINLAGLTTTQQRTGFINELQMALFTWITRHPSPELGAVLVMDEAQNFVPRGLRTACGQSTNALAAQARKYGLGMVFATQAPKGIDNQIVGNTATQFYGRLTAAAQINAAKELARQRGGALLDIARLKTAEFYLAAEGERFRKIRTANCLSHHPPSAMTPEEVTAIAAGTAPSVSGTEY
ncbi:helicase HerA domain-containing protein [Glycomyces tarimensis]